MNTIFVRWPKRLLPSCACLAFISTSSAAEVWVVTDSTHPVRASRGARVTELDAPARIERELAVSLPADAAKAAAFVRERMNRGGSALQRQLAEAYQGIVDAWSLGITKIPAVIVDRRYIVYGQRDVERAVAEIERYRSATP